MKKLVANAEMPLKRYLEHLQKDMDNADYILLGQIVEAIKIIEEFKKEELLKEPKNLFN